MPAAATLWLTNKRNKARVRAEFKRIQAGVLKYRHDAGEFISRQSALIKQKSAAVQELRDQLEAKETRLQAVTDARVKVGAMCASSDAKLDQAHTQLDALVCRHAQLERELLHALRQDKRESAASACECSTTPKAKRACFCPSRSGAI